MQTLFWAVRHPRRAWRGIVTMRAITLKSAREWQEARNYWVQWERFKTEHNAKKPQ